MKTFTGLVLLFLTFFSLSTQDIDDDYPLKKGLEEFFHTGNASDEFHQLLRSHQFPHLFREGMKQVYDTPTICYYCNLVVDLVIEERRLGLSRDTLVQEVALICKDLNIETDRVCKGVVELNVDLAIYIIDNYVNFTSNRFCGLVLQSTGCPAGDAFEWTVDIAAGDSPARPQPNDTSPGLTILHLGDVHFDPDYIPGGNAVCGEPVCCESDQGEPATPDDACGYWTDYRSADISWLLVEETIRMAKTKDVDYVYFTGDIVRHKVWDTSIESNSESITQLYSYLKEQFDVPVFPVFGNHEPHPLNLWPPESVSDSFSLQWLFELAAEHWSDLIGEDVSETVLKGGYYSVSPRPGFRVIGINSNVGFTDDFWLIWDDVDPYNQLQWLADTLKQAEDNNESVHILSHVPSGSSTSFTVWNREFAKIVERFANTITGIFNGHSHKDQFHVYYNSSNPIQAIAVAFDGASVGPSDANPSFKYFYADDNTFNLLDYEEIYFNLSLANSLGAAASVDWQTLYSFVDAYGVNSLLPSEVNKVVLAMTQDHTLLDDYFRFKGRNVDLAISGTCDDDCKKELLCNIVTTVHGNDLQCNRFLALYDQ